MRYAAGTINRVRSTMKPANPVPNDSPAEGWDDQRARSDLYSIMALGSDETRVPRAATSTGIDRPQRDRPPRPSPRPGGRLKRVLAPIAAVIAVTGVIIGLTVARVATRPATGASAASHGHQLTAGRPNFYVTVAMPANEIPPLVAEVRASATGNVLSRVALPRDLGTSFYMTSDGSDLAYVIGGNYLSGKPTSATGNVQIALVLLRVSSNGRSATVTRLPAISLRTPQLGSIAGLAVSPDRTELAVAVDPAPSLSSRAEILVHPMSGGVARVWTAPDHVGVPYSLTWTGKSQLTFAWQGHPDSGVYSGGTQIRVLDTNSRSGSLVSSRVLMTTGALTTITSAAAGPGDSPFVAAVLTRSSSVTRGTVTDQLLSLSPAGRVLRILVSHTYAYHSLEGLQRGEEYCWVFGTDGSGQNTLAANPRFGRIDRDTFTPLPSSPDAFPPFLTAAW